MFEFAWVLTTLSVIIPLVIVVLFAIAVWLDGVVGALTVSRTAPDKRGIA